MRLGRHIAFDLRLKAAIERVRSVDESSHDDRNIGTIIATLEVGLKNPWTEATYDALVMLMDFRDKERTERND